MVEIRQVWYIYKEHINQTAMLCKKESTSETTYHAVWSNQCIELWFLLHFSYMHSDIHRSEYWSKLTKHLNSIGQGDYRKNRDDMYHVLIPYIDSAISNAEKLASVNEGKLPTESAPGTMVYELVKEIKTILVLIHFHIILKSFLITIRCMIGDKMKKMHNIILVVGWLYDLGPTDRRADCPPLSF